MNATVASGVVSSSSNISSTLPLPVNATTASGVNATTAGGVVSSSSNISSTLPLPIEPESNAAPTSMGGKTDINYQPMNQTELPNGSIISNTDVLPQAAINNPLPVSTVGETGGLTQIIPTGTKLTPTLSYSTTGETIVSWPSVSSSFPAGSVVTYVVSTYPSATLSNYAKIAQESKPVGFAADPTTSVAIGSNAIDSSVSSYLYVIAQDQNGNYALYTPIQLGTVPGQ